jgi:hypothetical protein
LEITQQKHIICGDAHTFADFAGGSSIHGIALQGLIFQVGPSCQTAALRGSGISVVMTFDDEGR